MSAIQTTPTIHRTHSGNLVHGDCIEVLKKLPSSAIDLAVTDPPYLVNYRSSDGRQIIGDKEGSWILPAFTEIHRVLKDDSFCISFYGWHMIDVFMAAWKQAGFKPVGHIVWNKPYTSNAKYLAYRHEQAFLLAKGHPSKPLHPLPDVQQWDYSGNRLHPTQKSERIIEPLIRSFSRSDAVVLDPFCGSASTAVAAINAGRRYLAIEKDPRYYNIAKARLAGLSSNGISHEQEKAA